MAAPFYATVTCFPPLAQLTVLPAETKQVPFTVLVECGPEDEPAPQWEVVLLHRASTTSGLEQGHWAELPLPKASHSALVVDERPAGSQSECIAQYEGILPIESLHSASSTSSIERFTVKYRTSPHAHWHHVYQDLGTDEGELLVQRIPTASRSLEKYLSLNTGWNWRKIESGNAASVLSLHSSQQIAGYNGQVDSAFEECILGNVSAFVRWFAIVRYQEMWLGPRQGKDQTFLNEPALMISFLTISGDHLTLVAVNGVSHVQAHLRSQSGNAILVSARNDGAEPEPFRVIVAIAADLEPSISAAIAGVQDEISATPEFKKSKAHMNVAIPNPPISLERWYNGLAFCTYNSLGLDLSAKRILGALDSLREIGVYPPTLIIDDNWQTIGNPSAEGTIRFRQGMKRFEANSIFFPEGLHAAISEIRSEHPYIEDIAVWHALFGYWAGIEPDSELVQKYKTVTAKAMLVGQQPAVMTAIDPTDIGTWYDDFYAFLSKCGVTGVKTDVQCQLDLLTESSSRAAFARPYQDAWTSAHLKHFGGRAISCMSMIPQTFFHQFQMRNTPQIMLRNSDDFYPEFPKSHRFHVFVNAHNAWLTSQLNALPDWDMFQTKQEYGRYHAAARCLSGGPIYITDSPGEHDVELIHQMTGISPDGRTVAIRPTKLGRALWAYDSFADGKVLKIATESHEAGILGVFNNSSTEIHYLVDVSEISVPQRGGQVVVVSHSHGKVAGPTAADGSETGHLALLKLPEKGFAILTAVSVWKFSTLSVAVLGLLGKMTGAAAVRASKIEEQQGGVRIEVSLSALGELGVWVQCERAIQAEALIEGTSISSKVEELKGAHEKLVKVDLLQAREKLKTGDHQLKLEATVSILLSLQG